MFSNFLPKTSPAFSTPCRYPRPRCCRFSTRSHHGVLQPTLSYGPAYIPVSASLEKPTSRHVTPLLSPQGLSGARPPLLPSRHLAPADVSALFSSWNTTTLCFALQVFPRPFPHLHSFSWLSPSPSGLQPYAVVLQKPAPVALPPAHGYRHACPHRCPHVSTHTKSGVRAPVSSGTGRACHSVQLPLQVPRPRGHCCTQHPTCTQQVPR